MPVMLGKSVDPLGPDPNSSVVKIPEIEYHGDILRTVTSMILHKQVAVRMLGKLFIMSPNIRLERAERRGSGRHLFEFTQADFEIAHAKMGDVVSLVEGYYVGLTPYLGKEAAEQFRVLGIEPFEFRAPFKRHFTWDLEKEYGKDWETPSSLAEQQPFWAISHKREFYDKEDPSRPGTYLNYDVIYPAGYGEGLSGAEREHEHAVLHKKIKEHDIGMNKYKAYLEHAKRGFIPSAGAGIGMERLARFMTKSRHVSEVTLFKRVPGVPVNL